MHQLSRLKTVELHQQDVEKMTDEDFLVGLWKMESLLSLRESILLLAFCAFAVHLVYKRFEVEPSRTIPTFILLGLIPLFPSLAISQHFQSQKISILCSYISFYATLLTSSVSYRLSPFHPLAKYPGPTLAKMTKFWGVQVAISGKQHEIYRKLRDEYGSVVRVGPNELLITDAELIPSIFGADGMAKGHLWEGRIIPDRPHVPLVALRDIRAHSIRRKPWNRGFSVAAVKEYEPILYNRALQLVSELESRSSKGQAIDLVEWFSYFTFDFMGDMAFGGGFELMRDGGDREGIYGILTGGVEQMAATQNIPWVMRLLFRIPGASKTIFRMDEFGRTQIHRRRAKQEKQKDLFYYLGCEDQPISKQPNLEAVLSDGTLAVIAGSDTTSSVLSGIFAYLISHPQDYRRLREEVDDVFPVGEVDPFNASKLAEMPFLNAVINETLRLQPSVPTSLQRGPAKGSGGRLIGPYWIPEGTGVDISPYILHRDSRYFSPYTDEFWPDRWLPEEDRLTASPTTALKNFSNDDIPAPKEKPAVITNSAAFIPFSYGPANCAGKSLAILEMRTVVALLVQRFVMTFANGYDPERWERDVKDYFLVKLGKLQVVLTPRPTTPSA